uniref:Putative reverse transcriptase domain-containing protein n=1 Tax=Tanacetum cinerariifolium TaxID=118510 RepID=A0A6L2NNM0_TANCI|nr:putative reverse transcriptase domain-containing protein [Tanacetum cinerariifolium]
MRSYVDRMPPKRNSASAASVSDAPTMNQTAIRQLVIDSIVAALEAQAANMANADNTNRNPKPREVHVARKYSYKEFMRCEPFIFKCSEGAVGLIRILTEEALSWWNSFAQTIGIKEAYKLSWVKFKKLLISKGLPRSIEGNFTSSKPQTLEEAISIAQSIMDQKFCEAPILALPKGNDDFVVYCDASHQGMGAVLMQREKRSYATVRRKPLELQVGDHVMLEVSHRKGVIRFGKQGKLNPRYIGPFKILDRIGPMAYKLEVSEELSNVYSTFNISNLKKCLFDESLVIPMKELWLDDKLNFVEKPVEILDREVKHLKQSRIPIVKVRWNSKRGPEFTWELEDQIHPNYPHLFLKHHSGIQLNLRTRFLLREGDYNNP